ncbi:MAG TPA: class I SAM-dependent methyltransferase [Candidatus Limnocylindrales bacterium]|nr:class I SAM-dependent methyltransferase [Candidatus Limnocylindrales bacterium]
MTLQNRKLQHLQAYYDLVWSSPNTEILTRLRFQTSCREFAFECLGDLKGKRLLEIGPGQGQETLFFAKEGAQVYAVDISCKSLRLIKNISVAHEMEDLTLPEGPRITQSEQRTVNHRHITLIQANAEQLPFKEETFDRIFAQTMLMHTDFLQVARESARILRPGGIAVFMEPLRLNPLLYFYRKFRSTFKLTSPHYINLKDVEQMGSFFKTSFHREFYLTALLGICLNRERKVYQKIKQNLEYIDSWLIQWVPFLRSFCWMTVMRFEK